jgi:hypothetical protein
VHPNTFCRNGLTGKRDDRVREEDSIVRSILAGSPHTNALLMSMDPKMFRVPQGSMSAQELTRDFVSTARTFADEFVQLIAPDDAVGEAEVLLGRRRETCAALWAAIVATFDASALTDHEKARIVPLVRQEMLAAWNRHCAGDAAVLYDITDRSNHYLRNIDRASQLKTATNLLKCLLESIDTEAASALPARRLAAMVAHRMLGDLQRLNEIKADHSID